MRSTKPPARDSSIGTLGAAFAAACKSRSERPFLTDADMRLTGDQAAQWSLNIAGALQTSAIFPGDRVAFLSRPTALHTLAWFSVIRLGAIATNLHLLEKPERLAETVAWLDAKIVIFDSEFSDLVQGLAQNSPQVRFIQLDDLAKADQMPAIGLDAGAPKDPVAVVLSSGSTGRPKGIVHTNSSMLASIAAGADVYRGLDQTNSVLICIGTSFGGWCNVVMPFIGLAARLVFQRRFEPQAFLQTLAKERITIAPLVPTMWRMALAVHPEQFDLSELRTRIPFGRNGEPQ